jgi:hypothetical protein
MYIKKRVHSNWFNMFLFSNHKSNLKEKTLHELNNHILYLRDFLLSCYDLNFEICLKPEGEGLGRFNARVLA